MRQVRFVKGFDYASRDFPAIGIHPAARPAAVATAAPGPHASYHQAFANGQLNSRVGARLPAGDWAVEWSAPLDPQLTPAFVLEDGDRIVVRSAMWALFDRAGASLGSGQAAGPPVVLDAAQNLFYSILPSGYFSAAHLSDGQPAYMFLPSFGDTFSRVYLARRGSRILVVGEERALDPHGERQPWRSLVEINDVGDPVRTSAGGRVTGSQPVGSLEIPSPHVVAASAGDTIVAAAPGEIYVTNWKLEGRAVLEGSFEPRAMSLDEAGRIYLIVESGDKTSLWLLTADGERVYSYEFPPGSSAGLRPPMVGYDHTVYAIAGRFLYAIGPDGKLNWSREAKARLSGAVVSGDDQLLTSEGSQVVAWNQAGERRVVHSFDEELTTPPVLTADGRLLVASRRALYSLVLRR